MAEKTLGPEFWIHGGGLDLVFPHHENERAQSQARRASVREDLDAQRAAPLHRREDVEVGRERRDDPGGDRGVGAGDGAALLPDGPLAQAARVLAGDDDRRRRAGGDSAQRSRAARARATGDWERFAAVLDDDFNTPAALAVLPRLGARRARSPSCSAGSRSSGSASLGESIEAPAEVVALAQARIGGSGRDATSRSRTAAGRDRRRPAGRCGTSTGGFELVPLRDPRARLRPERRARGAARPPGGARALGLRARRGLARLARRRARGRRSQGARADRGRRDARSSGRRRLGEPYPYADPWELAAVEHPLLCCLDQVTDPRNLGAVIRSAAGAGATGVIVPAHGAGQVTPAVCRSSAGTVEHLPVAVVPNLARYLAEIKRDDLWSYAARPTATQRCGRRTSRAASRSSSEPRERACARSSARPATRTISIPLAQGVESLNVSVAAAALCTMLCESASSAAIGPNVSVPESVDHARADALPLRRLQPAPRGRARGRATSSSTSSRASSAVKGARGVVVFDGVGEELEVGALSVRYAPNADTLLERLAAEHRGASASAVSPRTGRARHVRPGGAQGSRRVLGIEATAPGASRSGPSHAELERSSTLRDRLAPETRATRSDGRLTPTAARSCRNRPGTPVALGTLAISARCSRTES